MLQLTMILIFVCIMAEMSCKWRHSTPLQAVEQRKNPFIIILIIPLVLLIGLRTNFNDTYAYINGFQNAPSINEYFQDANNYRLLNNPLFGLYTTIFREFTNNYHIYFIVSGCFVVISMISFFRNISENNTFSLSVFTYISIGTYVFAFAAMKQTIAMAILCWAVLALKDRKYFRFLLIVFIAGLFHTYAWGYVVLIFLSDKPWKIRTYIIVIATFIVMATFKETISSFLEYADSIGKSTSEEIVFSGEGMNIFRIAVYSIVPIASLIFRSILEPKMERKHYIMLHMSIVSFMFVLLASIDGANMFGRMARYFEIGTIYMFPWIIRNLFARKSQMSVLMIYCISFFAFFAYQYRDFDTSYSSISFLDFIKSII